MCKDFWDGSPWGPNQRPNGNMSQGLFWISASYVSSLPHFRRFMRRFFTSYLSILHNLLVYVTPISVTFTCNSCP